MDRWTSPTPTISMEEIEKEEEEFSSLPIIYKVIFLRDKMKWSWRKITRFLYPYLKGIEVNKMMLKIYGEYITIKRRMKNKDVISFFVITPPELIQLIDERDYLIKLLALVKDEERRREIYKKLNTVKSEILLYLIIWRFNLEKESGRIFGVYEKLKNRVDWGKDHVKMIGPKVPEWISPELSGLIITSIVSTIGVKPFLRELIELLSNGNEKKKKRILRIIMERFGDVVTQTVLLPFFS